MLSLISLHSLVIRSACCLLVCWLVLSGCPNANSGRAVAAEKFPSRPNIVFIMTDDQGYGDLACHGNPIIQTPHLDQLHQESARFTEYNVSPTCAPTRSALMTSRHEFRNGVTHTIFERERLALNAVTLPQLLLTAGYQTGIFGKWHLGDEDAYQPQKRGFLETYIHGGGGIGQTYPGSCGDAPGNKYFDPVIRHNSRFEKTQGYCTDVFFSQASHWIEAVRERPFFAYITLNAPHGPLDCPPDYEARYTGKVPPPVAKFYGMITNIDDNVGKLMARLKDLGLEQNTLVIFQTDNGTATGHTVFNAGMRGAKGTPYRGGIRVPAFWRWPGVIAPGDRPQLTAHLDVCPTLCELAGAEVPAEVRQRWEGRSLTPLLSDPAAAWESRILFTHLGRWPHEFDPRREPDKYKYAQCSVRDKRYQLVNTDKMGRKLWQLYDLQSDPGEQKDIAASQPEVVRRLEAAYDQWWTETVPQMVNENITGPARNPFHTAYWEQYQGPGPNGVPPPTPASK